MYKRKAVKKALLTRKTAGAFLVILQIAFFLFAGFRLLEFLPYVWGAMTALSVVLILSEINREGNPTFQMTWVALIGVIPVFGCLFYLYIRSDFITYRLQKRAEEVVRETEGLLTQDESILTSLSHSDPQMAGLFSYLWHKNGSPVYKNTAVKYLPAGEEKYRVLLDALQNAKKFIFLEYFIIREGSAMWESILEVLTKKAREGVEVRLLYDGMGCLSLLPDDYPEKMKRQGIACKVFSPMKPFLSTYQNNRDHRKIVVIDGQTAFCGGINLSDEYINKKKRFGHWKDTAAQLSGDAVRNFTVMFLQMWQLAEKTPEAYEHYLLPAAPSEESGFAAPFGDSPFDRENVGEMVYLHLLNTATRYVHVMSPYLVPDNNMLVALKFAAKRGVDVKLILPHIPDKWYAFALARTYYPELLAAGVKIYEYTPGFVHAKVSVSDDEKAVVGTINHDFRSLYLHFECASLLYQNAEILNIEADFNQTLAKCQPITMAAFKQINFFSRLTGRILRLFAPMI